MISPCHHKVRWLGAEARRFIPDTSKTADVIDFATSDFLSNLDQNNWVGTRDRIYERHQLNVTSQGFRYRGWTESSVNLATGVVAMGDPLEPSPTQWVRRDGVRLQLTTPQKPEKAAKGHGRQLPVT